MKDRFNKVYSWIGDFTDIISGVAMALIFLVVFFNVVLRYVFNAGFAWAVEAAQFAYVLVCLTGLIAATRDQSHFAVTLITERVPKSVRLCLFLLRDVVEIVCTIWLFRGAIQMMGVLKNTISPAIGLPWALNYYFLLGTTILMLFYEVCCLVKDIMSFFTGKQAQEEKKEVAEA